MESDNREVDRRNIRNQLEEFVNQEINFIVKFLTAEEMQEIENIKYWHNGEYDDYLTYLKTLTQRVESEKELIRLNKFQELCNFVNRHSTILRFRDDYARGSNEIESWTDGKTEEYASKLEWFTALVEKETERQNRKNDLINFVRAELKPGGNLCNYEKRADLKELKNWNNGTRAEYVEKYNFLKKYTELETDRKNMHNKLVELISRETSPGGMLTEYKLTDLNKIKCCMSGTTVQYIKKYDELIKIINHNRESLRCKHKKKLFDFIELERKPEGVLHQTSHEQTNPNIIIWLSVKERLDESTEYYVDKQREFSTYVTKEKNRRAERKKLFDLIQQEKKRGGLFSEVDGTLSNIWISIKGRGGETFEFYNIKYDELLHLVKERNIRAKRKELILYIETLENKYGNIFENESGYRAQLDNIKKQHYGTAEEYADELENLKQQVKFVRSLLTQFTNTNYNFILFQWKFPLLCKATRSEYDQEIRGLIGKIKKHDALVMMLVKIQSQLNIEVSANSRIDFDATEVSQHINAILQSVKSFAECHWYNFKIIYFEILKIDRLNVTLQEKILKILAKNQSQ